MFIIRKGRGRTCRHCGIKFKLQTRGTRQVCDNPICKEKEKLRKEEYKRNYRKTHTCKPKAKTDDEDKRKCLKCGDKFESAHTGNRICPECTLGNQGTYSIDDYQVGVYCMDKLDC